MSRLKEIRKEAGFRTAADFAEKVGVPPTTYSRHEQNPIGIPPEKAVRYANELCCTLDDVYGREGGTVQGCAGSRTYRKGKAVLYWKDFVDGCPECKSAEIELVETEVFGTEYREHYKCPNCGMKWADVFVYDWSCKEEE